MLHMKCTECEGIISSPFLVEIGSVTCNQCEENVSVKDVIVTTKSFTIPRDILLERTRSYRAILREIEDEKGLQGNSDATSVNAQKALAQYSAAIQELLDAARGNYRLPISRDLPLDIECEGGTAKGKLVNLSTKGAAINTHKLIKLPQKGSEIKLRLTLPDIAEPFSITAKIAWTRKCAANEQQNTIKMGISFIDLTKKIRTYIWDYIVCTYKYDSAFGS